MIKLFEKLLQRLGIVPVFDEDDTINAEIEDKARDNERALGRLQDTYQKKREANTRLRHSIAIASQRTNSFEQFEQLIAAGRNDGHH